MIIVNYSRSNFNLLRKKCPNEVEICYILVERKRRREKWSIMTNVIRIAICEDNQEHADILKRMVERWAERKNIEIDIGYYKSGEQFLFYMNEDAHYDLAFLDIQLERMNGLQLAKLIRKEDKTIFLVFTTGEKNRAVQGYEVSAFRYLVKPLRENEVIEALNKISIMLDETKKEVILINCNDVVRRIYKSDIFYVEVDDHYIILHTKQEKIRFKAKLKEFEEQFQEPQFCKCHRSYIVNLHYVSKISKDGLEIENGMKLSISRTRWEALNRCYVAYYAAR